MTFNEFMSELFKVVLEKVKEQTFVVLLLLGATYGVYTLHEKTEAKLENKIAAVESDLKICNDERGKLSVMFAELKAKFETFAAQSDRKRS